VNIRDYFSKLQEKSFSIFAESLRDEAKLGSMHSYTASIYELSEVTTDAGEAEMIRILCSQLEASCLTAAFGFYRQAMTSLRLAFELGLGVIHFSINKLEFQEWKGGRCDIVWSKLIDHESGVISKRFVNAFAPELSGEATGYNERARKAYRALSQFVHGNNETWLRSGITIAYDQTVFDEYELLFTEVTEILAFSFLSRYIGELDSHKIDDIATLTERLVHIDKFREKIGGPGEIK